MFSDDEIVTYVSTVPTEANDEEDDQPIKPAISRKEAIQSLTTEIKWYEGQDEAELPKIISLRQIHNLVLEKYGRQNKNRRNLQIFLNHFCRCV